MNLLFTLTAYPPSIGGAQIHQHQLALKLKERHPIQVVSHWDANRTDWLLGTTLHAPTESHDYTIDGIPVHRLGFTRREKVRLALPVLVYYFLMEQAAARIARPIETHLSPFARQADLIHNVRIGREPLSLASLQTARHLGIPFILTPVHHPRWSGWRYRLYNNLYRQAGALIALTQSEKETLVALGVAPERIFVTGIGPVLAQQAEPKDFRKKHHIEGPIVLFLGQHYEYKGYRQVLEAAPLVWQRFPDAHFLFIGPAVGESEKAFAAQNDPRLRRLGRVDLQEKTDALAACTLLCVPSSQESFGGVYVEAWSFAHPVIACPIPAVREVVSPSVDGLLVEQEAGVVADAICELLGNPSRADALGRAGYQKVQNHFTWDKLARKTEEVYQSVMKQFII